MQLTLGCCFSWKDMSHRSGLLWTGLSASIGPTRFPRHAGNLRPGPSKDLLLRKSNSPTPVQASLFFRNCRDRQTSDRLQIAVWGKFTLPRRTVSCEDRFPRPFLLPAMRTAIPKIFLEYPKKNIRFVFILAMAVCFLHSNGTSSALSHLESTLCLTGCYNPLFWYNLQHFFPKHHKDKDFFPSSSSSHACFATMAPMHCLPRQLYLLFFPDPSPKQIIFCSLLIAKKIDVKKNIFVYRWLCVVVCVPAFVCMCPV
jgi:hypothetical protein